MIAHLPSKNNSYPIFTFNKLSLSFLGLEVGVPFHDVLEVLVCKTVQPTQVILVVDNLGLWLFVGSEVNEVLGLFLTELDPRGFQMPPHLFNLDVAFAFGV